MYFFTVQPFKKLNEYGMEIIYPTEITKEQCDYYEGVYQNRSHKSKSFIVFHTFL